MDETSYGVKRKREHDEEQVVPPGVALVEQRKSILDISMFKLKLGPYKHEPSLRRSVLIFNTLKYIENELQQEGIKLNPASTPYLLPAIETGSDTLDPLPVGPAASPAPPPPPPPPTNSFPNQPPLPKCGQDAPSVSVSLPSKDVTDISASDSPSRTSGPDTDPALSERTSGSSLHSSFSASLPESWDSWVSMVSDTRCILDTLLASDRLTVTSFTSLFDLDTGGAVTAAASPNLGASPCASAANTTSSSPSCGTVPLSSTPIGPRNQDSCLSDLDLSLLDFDLFSPVQGKLPSLSPDELTNSLPTCNDAFTSLNTSCNPKHEHFSEDLDHIMQVLVGI